MRHALLLFVLPCFAPYGCSSAPETPPEVEAALTRAMASAKLHDREGRTGAAWQLVDAIRRVDPDYPDLADMESRLSESRPESIFDRPFLGSNLARRERCERPVWARILLYLPDRVLDVLDLLSFDAHLGIGVLVNLHVTRAMQVGAGARVVTGIGWHDLRSLGIFPRAETEISLPAIGTQAYTGLLAGTSGIRTCSDALFGLHRPSRLIYQTQRDYWEMGFAVTAGIVGFDFDLHPLEIADLLAGIVLVDFLHDDFAGTCSMGLPKHDQEVIWQLFDVSRDQRLVEDYLHAKNWVPPEQRADDAAPDPARP